MKSKLNKAFRLNSLLDSYFATTINLLKMYLECLAFPIHMGW